MTRIERKRIADTRRQRARIMLLRCCIASSVPKQKPRPGITRSELHRTFFILSLPRVSSPAVKFSPRASIELTSYSITDTAAGEENCGDYKVVVAREYGWRSRQNQIHGNSALVCARNGKTTFTKIELKGGGIPMMPVNLPA